MLDALAPQSIPPDERVPASLLNAALDEAGVSQTTLSKRLGVTLVTVNRWARGKTPISTSRWIAIKSALGLPPGWQPSNRA